MSPEQRRFLVTMVLGALFMLVYWIGLEASQSSSEKGVKFAVKKVSKRFAKPSEGITEKKKNRKEDSKIYDEDYSFLIMEEEHENDEDEHSDDDDEEAAYAKTFRGKSHIYIRTSAFHFDLHACLPKFICEIHAHALSSDLTELEKDIIGLFRNYVVLEGPGSPVYTYQLAAHMGQLVTGLDPSPCRELYPSCPLSRPQMLDILRNIKTSRRMFY